MKTCTKCGEEKEESAFGRRAGTEDGLAHWCKHCKSESDKAYRLSRPEETKLRRKLDYLKNRERYLRKVKEWKEANAQRRREQRAAYFQRNKSTIIKKATAYVKDRRKKDSFFLAKLRIRSRLSHVKNRLSKRTATLLGCDSATFLLTVGAIPDPSYHLDHICPLAQANTTEEIERLCHYSNLRWISSLENHRKSDNWTPEGEELCLKLLGRPWIHKEK